ncbi:Sialidase [Pyrenochaeta sp. MPI-SDFR-AT-0127]|nr:Sialidase [Pyrenochaeta sp. MPI-SDFR-AT-0127]
MLRAFIAAVTAIAAFASPAARAAAPQPWTNFSNNGVFFPNQSATSWRTVYGRTLQLPDNSILLSWEDYDPTVQLTYFPIYKSVDGGATFQNFSRVNDQVNGWGNWYQPFLYTLPQAFGGYPAGTVLLAGVSTPRNLAQAYIDLYASTNGGKDWNFVSHIVYGPGPETIARGDKAVWEPFLLMHQGRLICYYSTQVDPNHNQKLSHTTTTDLRSWSSEVNDVALADPNVRPGMATVAYSPISKKYVMTFEFCGGPIAGGCPVYYKVSDSPLTFGSAGLQPIIPNDGNLNPNGSPYVIWTAEPGSNGNRGLFIANGNSREEIFVNTDAVNPTGWKPINVGQWSAYSRELRIINTPANSAAGGTNRLLITNGGNMGCSGSCYNWVANGVINIPTYPA